MDSSQQINEALNRKDYKKALLIALSNSLKIKLTTSLKTKDNNFSISKEIDLIQGSKTYIDSELLADNHQNIVDFHQRKTNEIYQTWEQNREILLKAFKIMAGENINFESLQVSNKNDLEGEELNQEYISNIPDNFDDFSINDEEDKQIISEEEFNNVSQENEKNNQFISNSEFDNFNTSEEENNQYISETESDGFDSLESDDIEEDEFTRIISPDEVAEASYDNFDDDFGEDSTEENWVDDVVIQDSENSENISEEIIAQDYVSIDEEESEALFEETDFEGLGEINSSDESQDEEADWDDLLEDNQTNASAEEVTPTPEEDSIDDWNEWIETQDGGEISCNPEEIDWSEDEWKDTPA